MKNKEKTGKMWKNKKVEKISKNIKKRLAFCKKVWYYNQALERDAKFADVVESADTLAWGASGSNIVQVQVLSSAPDPSQTTGIFLLSILVTINSGIINIE